MEILSLTLRLVLRVTSLDPGFLHSSQIRSMLASVPYLQICTLLARCSGATIMSLLPNVISLTRNEPNVWFRRHRLSGRGIQGTDSAAPRDCWYRIGGSSAGARL